jgi:hypothetical protein
MGKSYFAMNDRINILENENKKLKEMFDMQVLLVGKLELDRMKMESDLKDLKKTLRLFRKKIKDIVDLIDIEKL